jgi:curved DNA-binding protein CbpA
MGNIQSIDPSHVKIFNDLRTIQNPSVKVRMIQTVLAGPEYVASAKHAGVYSDLLAYLAKHRNSAQPTVQPISQQLVIQSPPKQNNIDRLAKANSDEKAIGYFQACLEVLGLEEEVALNEEILKKIYKKAVLKHHPDKGGSEKEFEKVTRAYAYLGEILRRINGGRSTTVAVDAPNVLKDSRAKDYESVKHVDPVKLNPKKLDLSLFNKMFEQTRIPDPEEDGYGDWLKSENQESSGPKFSGKFNRDVFNKAFEDEAKSKGSQNYIINQPQSMIMAPTLGVELGRGRPESFTAAMNADLNYTDLKQAYTSENMFSHQVAHVNAGNRNYEQYKNDYGKTPTPLSHSEMDEIQRGEAVLQKREEQRKLRAAQEDVSAQQYFERIKQLVITDKSKET